MKLLSLIYENLEQEWNIEEIDFFDLTLLVGVSGVGKTQILRSIQNLKAIAGGSSSKGVKWDVEFKTLKENRFRWKGEFSKGSSGEDYESELFVEIKDDQKPKILFEQILLNGEVIVLRNTEVFKFKNIDMPKLSSTESSLSILKEEEVIKDAYDSFRQIVMRDYTAKEGVNFSAYSLEKLKKNYGTFEEVKKGDLDTFHKLALIYDIAKPKFDEIKERFIEVFPQVSDIKVEPLKNTQYSNLIFETTVIKIKEHGIGKWIPHTRMSSGMLRTLIHISEMYLWNEGTVILIDEFENSLGLNCIDFLTQDLIYENTNIQFIATSHHPYIINKIPYDYWKIVTRKSGTIKTFDAKDFDLGKSHHDKFLNLINHPFYKQGIS